MRPQFYLQLSDADDGVVKCSVTERKPEPDATSVALKIPDARLVTALHQASPEMKELLELIVTQVYHFAYEQAEFATGVLTSVDFSTLSAKSERQMSFSELYQLVTGNVDVTQKKSEEAVVAARRDQFQAIEDEILKHEPGSGVASLDLRGYMGRPNPVDP